MKLLNIFKKIELENYYKKNKRKPKLKLKLNLKQIILSFIIQHLSLVIAVILYAIAIITSLINKDSLYPFWLLLISLLLIHFNYSQFIYRSFKKDIKSFTLPVNHSINFNVKGNYVIDKKYLKALISLDMEQLKFGYLELNHEYECLKRRINLVLGPLDKLGIFPGIVSLLGLLPQVKAISWQWIEIIPYSYGGLMILGLFFYNNLDKYERMLALIKLAIELKEETN
ncbi:hypothetical protein A9G28_09745 [Gilliamella sp. Fer1-1]|jgi:hypothetical protein|uniref:hypothetical protein n=1 Tax=Gilliamella sp. Fer1-1 TaxID=3120240 RepID=UPI00080DBA50|nr:hypothetical protein [Gilliamella apicola]OCG39334.1 hypothetical protein A9G28_09745 [Gilliamella apicola]